ncbi:MAG: hypothetical protein IJG63_02915 [Oscillospiraceae bacterium]|nr:hypothetical protein [Oscillospiraceae bacterium]
MMLKFDTRDKKPKVYNIAVLSVIAAVIIAALIRDSAGEHELAICLPLIVYFLIVLVMLICAFFRQIQYNPYSYNTIYYMGFALFTLSVLITYIVIAGNVVKFPGVYGPEQFVSTLLGSAKTYMLLSAPFILVFSLALFISNIALIRHEGKRLVNLLGIILSFLLVAGELF